MAIPIKPRSTRRSPWVSGRIRRNVGLLVVAASLATAMVENGPLLLSMLDDAPRLAEAGRQWSERHPVAGIASYVAAYVGLAMLGLPIHAMFAVYAGFVYPPALAMPLAWLARGLGDAAGFLAARHFLRDRRHPGMIERFQAAVGRSGLFYLLVARVVPGIPSPVVNVAMAISPVPFRHFLAVSMLGISVWTGLLVHAGAGLRQWRDPSELVTPSMLGLVLLAAGLMVAGHLLGRRTGKSRARGAEHGSSVRSLESD